MIPASAIGVGIVVLCLLALGFRRFGEPADGVRADGGYDPGHALPTEKPTSLWRWLVTVDHFDIGLLYLVFATVAGLWGAMDAMMLRTELLAPGVTIWEKETYNAVFTTHGLTMLFFFATPAFVGLGNILVPLLVGTDDMAYPRINAIAFWLLPASLALVRAGLITEVTAKVFSFVGYTFEWLFALKPIGVGWTLYTPLSLVSQLHGSNPQITVSLLGLHLSGLATTMAAINFIATIFVERDEHVTWARLDILSWALLTMSALILFAFPLLGAALVMLVMDRAVGTVFFVGRPLLWQHLFWFFGHPEVYILVLPAFGLVSYILPKFTSRQLFGFRFVVYSTLAIGVLSFGVWAHHMFTTGMDPRLRASFMAISLAIAVPSAVKTFNWISTMWNGRVRLTAPMLFCVGGVSTFIVGGVTGVFLASIPVDLLLHDTYYVVGHFHFIIMGIIVFAAFAASYYYFPLITGRMFNQRLARAHAWISLVGVFVAFTPMMWMGMMGHPRRYATYPAQFQPFHITASIGAFVLMLGAGLWLWNVLQSARIGPIVTDADVWNLKESDQFTREWQWFEEQIEGRTYTGDD